MPKVSEEYLEARRNEILAAATACFSRDGFHRTSMQAICREAGLSPGAVYRYFQGKDEIIEAMTEEGRRRNESMIAAAMARQDPEQTLEQLAEDFFAIFNAPDADTNIRVNIQLWAEALRNPRIMQLLQRRMSGVKGAFTEIILQAQSTGSVSADLDAEAVARMMIALFQGLMLQKGLDPDVDVHKYLQAMKAMDLSGQVSAT